MKCVVTRCKDGAVAEPNEVTCVCRGTCSWWLPMVQVFLAALDK